MNAIASRNVGNLYCLKISPRSWRHPGRSSSASRISSSVSPGIPASLIAVAGEGRDLVHRALQLADHGAVEPPPHRVEDGAVVADLVPGRLGREPVPHARSLGAEVAEDGSRVVHLVGDGDPDDVLGLGPEPLDVRALAFGPRL